VVQDGVETFENRLLSQVHLINEEPVALLDGLQQHSITPTKLYVVVVVCRGDWVLGAQQVHHVGLVTQVHPD
jgi:hypothetical protein